MIKKNTTISYVKGILAIIFGLFALFKPSGTITTLVTIFGILALVGGGVLVALSIIRKQTMPNANFWLVEGVIDLIVGLLIIIYPKASVSVLLVIIGIWAIVAGVIQLATSKELKEILNTGFVTINSLVLIIFGLILLIKPFEGGTLIFALLGIFALYYGGTEIYTAYKINQQQGTVTG